MMQNKEKETCTTTRLTEEQLNKFKEDGFVVVKDVFDKSHLEAMKRGVENFVERSRHITQSDDVYDLQEGHTPEKPLLRRVYIPHHYEPIFAETHKYPGLLDIISQLIGPSFRYIPQDKINIKLPRIGVPAQWHQDWAFYPHTNDSLVTVCVALTESHLSNGCLRVLPGSHKGPVFSHFDQGEFASSINDPAFDPSLTIPVELEPGDISIHHLRMVHGSAINKSDKTRTLWISMFGSMDAWPLCGVAGRDFRTTGPVDFDLFNSTMVRGEICRFPRLEKIPACLPVPFKSEETRSIYFSRIRHEDLEQ